jgi:hypothetical protein
MTLPFLAFLALLALLVLWGVAFWKRPQLGYGILIGVIAGCVLTAILKPLAMHEIPIWLPPLPFAVVAVSLFSFGFLAWYWGNE